MSKTVLFFHRCELAHMYIAISKHLPSDISQVHVAYSMDEYKLLCDEGITPDYVFEELVSSYIDNAIVDDTIIKELDEMIVSQSGNGFNLNGSIQSDRGLSILTYKEALLLTQSYYVIWKQIFSKYTIDVFIHEPCSLSFNHIAALLCQAQGGHYIYHVPNHHDSYVYSYAIAEGDKFDYKRLKYYYNYFIQNTASIDTPRCERFLNKFRSDISVFFGANLSMKRPISRLVIQSCRFYVNSLFNKNKFHRVKQNINYWMYNTNPFGKKLKNIINYYLHNISFVSSIPDGELYYYYAMHLEPEATVLYLGGGIYENQIKLIQNIAASIPPGTYLYVKDHPHEYAYREAIDYERLQNIPNVRLIHQDIPGKALIKNSIGVFTINGTAGFEALLMNKQVYCFALNQYSFHKRVVLVDNIKQLRKLVYDNIGVKYDSDTDLYPYIAALLESTYEGYVDYFCNRAISIGIDDDVNGRTLATGIVNYIKWLDESTNQ